MIEAMLCVTFVDPDGKRFDFVATKSLATLPRVGERLSLGKKPWNVLDVRDVMHQLDGASPVLTCVPLAELDSNQKRQDMLELLRIAGFKDITANSNQQTAEWRKRSEQRGETL